MGIDIDDFRVREGDKVVLKKCPTQVKPVYHSKEQYETLLSDHTDTWWVSNSPYPLQSIGPR